MDSIDKIASDWLDAEVASAKERAADLRTRNFSEHADRIEQEIAAGIDNARASLAGRVGLIQSKIESKDRRTLRSLRCTDNRYSRRIFAVTTGIKLPSTQKASLEAVITWFGRDEWAAADQADADARKAEQEQKQRDREAADMQRTIANRYRCDPPGGGLVQAVTFGELVATHLDMGYQPAFSKRGPFEIAYLENGQRRIGPFKKKLEIQYIREQFKEPAQCS